MTKKMLTVPAFAVALALVGGGTALAFGPGGFNMAAFSSFTSEEQAALQRVNEIRETAHTEAQAVLDSAGITQEEMRGAMHAYRNTERTAMREAVENNDYAAYKELASEYPNASVLTEDVFAKMVAMHAHMQAGEYEEARELREELRNDGSMFGGLGRQGGGHGKGMRTGLGAHNGGR